MKVLIAEDDPVFQFMLERSLSKWGYEVVTASDGEEALRLIQSRGGPQVALLDWMMPKMDGLEVCRRVRAAKLPGYVYIILLTAKQGSNLVPGFEAGADDYLFKPFDINELRLRLRAASRVLEAGQWYRSIAETASDGIVILQDQAIVFANSAAEEIFGFPAGQMPGREFSQLVSGIDPQAGSQAETGAGEGMGRRPSIPIEITAKHQSGRDIELEITTSEFVPFGQSNHITVVIRDVTQRNVLKKQREQTYKMQSLGQLAAGVAHEINTPIQYIGDNIGFLQESYQKLETVLDACAGLAEGLTDQPGCLGAGRIAEILKGIDYRYLKRELPRALEQSLEGVDQVAGIVAVMKDFSHPGTTQMLPTDLNHLIESAAVISKNEWKYIADLQMKLDPDLPPVVCASGDLRQVLLNLIVNAVDAVADALKLTPGRRGLIRIESRCDGQMAEIRVADSGTGIPESIRAKVFDLFFTTKGVGKGSGQGLALAYAAIVKRHAGSIKFESEPGGGTTFILRLPIRGANADTAA